MKYKKFTSRLKFVLYLLRISPYSSKGANQPQEWCNHAIQRDEDNGTYLNLKNQIPPTGGFLE